MESKMTKKKDNAILGRPTEIENGRYINVYLDKTSAENAKKIGMGNISLGVRKAIKFFIGN